MNRLWVPLIAILGVASAWAGYYFFSQYMATPRIEVDKETINFGVIDENDSSPRYVQFKIFNSGSRTLHVNQIVADCTCIKPLIGESNIPSGHSTYLSFSVGLPSHGGTWDAHVAVKSDDPVRPLIYLSAKAFIRSTVKFRPPLLEVSGLSLAEPKKATLIVDGGTSDEDFSLNKIETESPFITIGDREKIISSNARGSAQVSWKINLAIQARGEAHWHSLVHVNTSSLINPNLEIPVDITETDAVEVRPAMLLFDDDNAADGRTATIELRADREVLPLLQHIEHSPWLEVDQLSSSGNTVKYSVRLVGEVSEEHVTGFVRFIISSRASPLELPIHIVNTRKHN